MIVWAVLRFPTWCRVRRRSWPGGLPARRHFRNSEVDMAEEARPLSDNASATAVPPEVSAPPLTDVTARGPIPPVLPLPSFGGNDFIPITIMAHFPSDVAPLFLQRLFQVVDLPVQMSVNLAYHRAIPMSHQFRDGQMIVSLHELPGRETVSGVIHDLLPAGRA